VIVGTLELHLRLDGCFSLKDKRQILRSLLDRARRDFHVSIAEIADNDLWNVATLGVACVSADAGQLESVLNKITDAIDRLPGVIVEGVSRRIERTD
jgi:uncharacterized protein YlxP (DUF503 family)